MDVTYIAMNIRGYAGRRTEIGSQILPGNRFRLTDQFYCEDPLT